MYENMIKSSSNLKESDTEISEEISYPSSLVLTANTSLDRSFWLQENSYDNDDTCEPKMYGINEMSEGNSCLSFAPSAAESDDLILSPRASLYEEEQLSECLKESS
jgi:hypothetical protein